MNEYPATVCIPTTGEILSLSHYDFEFHMGEVAVYVGFEKSETTVCFGIELARMFACE